MSTEVHVQAGPTSVNIQRLFEAHTITSKTKQKEKPREEPQTQQNNLRVHSHKRPTTITEVPESKEENAEPAVKEKQTRVRSAGLLQRRSSVAVDNPNSKPLCTKKFQPNSKNTDKENIPEKNVVQPPAKSKMWIRPKSGSQASSRKPVKKSDPVSLYQAYQKDWVKFKSNICESSHSDLRWSIREKMMGNH